MAKRINYANANLDTGMNMFQERERSQNTAQCQNCFTNWSTPKQEINRCPFCGGTDVLVTPGMF